MSPNVELAGFEKLVKEELDLQTEDVDAVLLDEIGKHGMQVLAAAFLAFTQRGEGSNPSGSTA